MRHEVLLVAPLHAGTLAELDVAGAVDVLVAACPGGAATRGLIGRAVLEAPGPHGFFVSVARGSVVDGPARSNCCRAAGSAAPDAMCSSTSRTCRQRC